MNVPEEQYLMAIKRLSWNKAKDIIENQLGGCVYSDEPLDDLIAMILEHVMEDDHYPEVFIPENCPNCTHSTAHMRGY
jgi:hypothetical protein